MGRELSMCAIATSSYAPSSSKPGSSVMARDHSLFSCARYKMGVPHRAPRPSSAGYPLKMARSTAGAAPPCPPGRQQQDGQSGLGRGSRSSTMLQSDTDLHGYSSQACSRGNRPAYCRLMEPYPVILVNLSQSRCDLCRFQESSILPNQDPPAYFSRKCDALTEACKSTGRERIEVHQRKHHNLTLLHHHRDSS
jgi:hypothetical protein